PRVEPGPAVAGAFQGHRGRHLGPPPQLVHGQGERAGHRPAHLQGPAALVGLGDVEVDQQVVEADRGDVVAQGLKGHAVVAGRALQLGPGGGVPRGPPPGRSWLAPLPCRRSRPRRSWALRATTIVDRLIRTAPTAGARVTPAQARAPAATGTASRLYPVAHPRFCNILW